MEVKLNELIGENGLYATKYYQLNSIVFELEGPIVSEPTRESIRIGENKHIIDSNGIYMNHSFDPTCKIDGNCVKAIKNIYPGDELNFNYNQSEENMANPFIIDGIIINGKNKNEN